MTREELAALIAEHSHTFTCPTCRGAWIVPRGDDGNPVILFHRCRPTRQSRWDFRTREERVAEDNRRWALTVFGEAVEEAVGPDAYLGEEE